LSAQLTLVLLLALGRPLTVWDSWASWGMRARAIILEGGIGAAAAGGDASRIVTHLDYPLLVPLLQAWLYAWLGAPDDRFAGLVPVLAYLALGGVTYSAARGWGAGRVLALAGMAAVLTIPHVAPLAGYALADLPLAAFAAVAAIYLLRWLERGSLGSLALAAAGAGLLPWVKREGLVLLGALCLAALIAGRPGRRARVGVGAFAASALVLAGPWWFYAAWQHSAAPDFLPVRLATLAQNAGRLPAIAGLALSNLAGADWSFLWPLAGLLGLSRLARGTIEDARPPDAVLPLAAAFYLAAMAVAFVFSDYTPYQQHVLTSWHRLAAHVAPLVVLWVVRAASAGPDAPTPTRPAK
jgi:hypothetical protein